MTEGVLTASSRLGHPSFNQVPCTLGLVSPNDKLKFTVAFPNPNRFPPLIIYYLSFAEMSLLRGKASHRHKSPRDHNYSLFIFHYSLKSHGSGCQFSIKHRVHRDWSRHATKLKFTILSRNHTLTVTYNQHRLSFTNASLRVVTIF